MDPGDSLSLSLGLPICKVGLLIESKNFKHLVNARRRLWHSPRLGTWTLTPALLMARFLNLVWPLFSHLKNGDNFNKAVVRINSLIVSTTE